MFLLHFTILRSGFVYMQLYDFAHVNSIKMYMYVFVYWITDKIDICISGQEAFELGYRNGGGAHEKNYCMVETIWMKLVIFFSFFILYAFVISFIKQV